MRCEAIDDLDRLLPRLKKVGVELELSGNYPWIYLSKVNGNNVMEKFEANHGFTIAWHKTKGDIIISDIAEVFKIIRKYR